MQVSAGTGSSFSTGAAGCCGIRWMVPATSHNESWISIAAAWAGVQTEGRFAVVSAYTGGE